TIGPERLTAPALTVDELPRIDIILLSHAHFDHIDVRTLRRISRGTGFSPSRRLRRAGGQPVRCKSGSDHRQDADATTIVITAPRTRDLLRWTRLRNVTELRCGGRK